MGLFIDHVNSVLRKLREDPITALSTDTTTEAFRAQEAVKRAVKLVWNARQWSFRLRQFFFTTTIGQAQYTLPKLVGETYKIKSSESPYDIFVVREDDFDRAVPNPTASGNPNLARLFEMVGVEAQPTSASVIMASSSAAGDTQNVLIKGLVNGQVDFEQITLSGTSNVSTGKFFSSIYAITKSDKSSGRITLTSNGGAVTNAVMAPQEKMIRLRVIRLYPTPASPITITVKNFALPPELTEAFEDSEIPPRWDYIVDQYSFALALQAKGQDQSSEFRDQIEFAAKLLEDDMFVEEKITSEEIIVPESWGGTGDRRFGVTALPSGYGYTV